MTLKLLDLFSGIGGFSLGLERTGGFETVAFCEIAASCRHLLAHHWPDVPILEDVTTLTAEQVGPVDAICGGFPCQPFSSASRGRRVAPDLWPHMHRVVAEFLPIMVIAENVAERPIRSAEADLRALGYDTYARRVSAAECGADHQRDRWWLCAYADPDCELSSAVDAEVAKLPELCGGLWGAENYSSAVRVSDGLSDWVDRADVEALGNAVLPIIPQVLGRALLNVPAVQRKEAA